MNNERQYTHILPFERHGIKLPNERGGGFIHGRHGLCFLKLEADLREFAKLYRTKGQDEYVKQWYTEGKRNLLYFSQKDLYAYQKMLDLMHAQSTPWYERDGYGVEKIAEDAPFDLPDFFVGYANIAKIGSRFPQWKNGIVSASHTPHIDYEPWFKDEFDEVSRILRWDYVRDEDKYFRKEPTLLQEAADRNKREEIEEYRGRPLGEARGGVR